jgi:hypothetical protein
MALIIVLVLLTIAIAAVMSFGDAGAALRLGRGTWLRDPARRTPAGVPASWTELANGPEPPAPAMSFGAQDTESILVALLLAGRLRPRDYQQRMAQLAAEDSARGARP